MTSPKEETSELEQYLIQQDVVKQAKVIDIIGEDNVVQPVAVVALDEASQSGQTSTSRQVKKIRKSWLKSVQNAQSETATPKSWIVLDSLPETPGGRIDEVSLHQHLIEPSSTEESTHTPKERRERLIANTRELLKKADRAAEDEEAPSTDLEIAFASLWSKILNLSPQDISRESTFLGLGGDSITAIALVTDAQHYGIQLASASIMSGSDLQRMADEVTIFDVDELISGAEPFSMLPSDDKENILQEICSQAGLESSEMIEDVYPCTPLQEGLMALAIREPGHYIVKQVKQLPPTVDVDKFRNAWQRTMQLCANLRTRIVLINGTFFQAVIKEDIAWEDSEEDLNPQTLLADGYGSKLCRYALSPNPDGSISFAWLLHHAIFDGIGIRIILDVLQKAYQDTTTPPEPPALYADFIRYVSTLDEDAASEYWRTELAGSRRTRFPEPLDGNKSAPTMSSRFQEQVTFSTGSRDTSITMATIMRGGWAMLLARYSDSDDVCFGSTLSGRHAPVAGINNMTGLTIATIPIRARLDPQQKVSSFLKQLQSDSSRASFYEQFGLQRIARLGDDAKAACDFSTLLVVQPRKHLSSSSGESSLFEELSSFGMDDDDGLSNYFNYPLVLQCHLYDDRAELDFSFFPEHITEFQVSAISKHFQHIVQQLLDDKGTAIADLSLSGPWDLQQALQWAGEPEFSEGTVHALVSQQASENPEREAIFSTAGSMTYAEVEELSDRVAQHLATFDVKTGEVVPVCFEKSAWAIIAMLGIMKAGAAFLPLDPTHPKARHEMLVGEVKARVIITHPSRAESCDGLVDHVISFFEASEVLSLKQGPQPTQQDSNSAAYVLFTSGTTGRPKGLIMEHIALCSSISSQVEAFGINNSSRVLQFSNYAFDVSIGEIFTTLAAGGTICTPTEAERMEEMTSFISSAKVNTALLTPSFLSTLTPSDVPTLKTLIVGGEAASKNTLEVWHGQVEKLINGYGPAEACVYCATHIFQSSSDLPTIIGRGLHSSVWVVEADNHDRLTPTGCAGELLVQGHAIARGYINDKSKTDESFIQRPTWMPSTMNADLGRLYKTGDLVRFRPDGTLQYLGRKDTQVKLRGQRLELGEIENNIKALLPTIDHVAVDVTSQLGNDSLVAFVSFQKHPETNKTPLLSVDEAIRDTFTNLSSDLRDILPGYMVPSAFVPVAKMPFNNSMKLDRRQLQSWMTDASREQLASFSLGDQAKVELSTDLEYKLRDLWSRVIGIQPEDIGKTDDFLQVGGDSITAIHLSSLAQREGLKLPVVEILQHSRLDHMAARIDETEDGKVVMKDLERFGLLPMSEDEITKHVRSQCNLQNEQGVEDAYPVTKLQEGLMALAIKLPGSYVAKYVYKLDERVDMARFKAAWEKTVEVCANLRTRIMPTRMADLYIQAAISSDGGWETTEGDIRQVITGANCDKMAYGTRLCRYGIAQEGSARHFVLIIHHAIFDGWTLNIVFDTLQQLYRDPSSSMSSLRPQPYARFIQHITEVDRDDASSYWKSQLQDATCADFPPSSKSKTPESRVLNKSISLPILTGRSITKATVLRAAWAIILARYCNTDDVCFGTTVSGRQASVLGLESMAGPTIATVPIRIKVDSSIQSSAFLGQIQSQASEMVAYEQFGLQNIAKLGSDAKDACDFSSLLVVQPSNFTSSSKMSDSGVFSADSDDTSSGLATDSMENYFTYPLVIQCFVRESEVDLVFAYDQTSVSEFRLQALANHFDQVVGQLINNETTSLKELSVSGRWDLEQAIKWNTEETEIIDSCVHELIGERARACPDAIAIQAWDGNFTYRELDQTANLLAHHLLTKEVQVGDLVLVCFEKSRWYFPSILAINKVGAAWVPLDPSHPPQRHQQLAQQTGAKLVLCSPSTYQSCCSKLVSEVIDVSENLQQDLQQKSMGKTTTAPDIDVSPEDAAYVLFTSGSTGTPKGLVMQHGPVCTSQIAVGRRLGMTPAVRMLQFAAFVFDFSIGEILAPLIHGASLHIPSESMRMNGIEQFIRDNEVNWAYLTPAFARAIKPEDVPSLELLLLGGEAVDRTVFSRWYGKVPRFINAWGPAEMCVFGSFHEWASEEESPLTIGRPVACNCWIVDPEDETKLAPIGTIGEVMIQGPTILREYLAAPEKTAAAITGIPDWVPKKKSEKWGRFYKTGDLCSYNPDGTLHFESRKDNQIKIRGLRVELGELEYHVRESLPGVEEVAVEVVKRDDRAQLVAFFCPINKQQSQVQTRDEDDIFLPMDDELRQIIAKVSGELAAALPSYMVPSLFLPCAYLPTITSTKLDRGKLRKLTENLSSDQLSPYIRKEGKVRPPQTETEILLQGLWAEILNLPRETIGLDDSFLRIGGDSIAAIHLAAVAREEGFNLTVKDIFDDPRLLSVAAKMTETDPSAVEEVIERFSLLKNESSDSIEATQLKEKLSPLIHDLSESDVIEDAFPCTPLQAGLMTLSLKQPGSYIAKMVYRLSSDVDVERFRTAWEQTVDLSESLRTRIVTLNDNPVQVVVRHEEGKESDWEDDANLEQSLQRLNNVEMDYGSKLCRFALVQEKGKYYFVLAAHHGVFDGWSLRLVLETFYAQYEGAIRPQLEPFSRFIQYVEQSSHDTATEYWKQQLAGAQQASFPSSTKLRRSGSGGSKDVTRVLRNKMDFRFSSETSITVPTILRAAWAIVLARYCNADDVCFGVTISGRQAPVAGIGSISGPTIATVPVRVQLDPDMGISDFLASIQQQATDMIPFEQFGLQKISSLGQNFREACDFTSLLAIQPTSQGVVPGEGIGRILEAANEEDGVQTDYAMQNYFTYPLVLQCHLGPESVATDLIYDSDIFPEAQLEALSNQLEHVARQLVAGVNDEKKGASLSSVSVASPWDVQQMTKWNQASVNTDITNACVHEMVEAQARIQPSAQAVEAWDGKLTYAELNAAADRLAVHMIREHYVAVEDIVMVCFEKSLWFFVSILAVSKAGAAWTPLDPSHPTERKKEFQRQSASKLAIASKQNAEACKELVSDVIQMDRALYEKLLQTSDTNMMADFTNPAKPQNAAYVFFTSGSTGKPKGVVIDHSAICTSQTAIINRLGINSNVRLLQFGSYIFDISVGEAFAALFSGACLVVPSEEQRLNNLPGFIADANVNWLFLPTAVARTIRPEQVPSVELLYYGGEAASRDIIDNWYGKARLINAWGPTEASVESACHEVQSREESPSIIGKPLGSYCWIAEPNDATKLAPIGCVGELIIQGPTLMREYLNDPQQTSAAIVEQVPEWAPHGELSGWGRLYKSGDLCSYNPDGTIKFDSRKDGQVKIRGLRVELGEIEHQICACVDEDACQAVVDVFKTEKAKVLIAFFCFNHELRVPGAEDDAIILPMTSDLRLQLATLSTKLRAKLPPYMVPTIYVPCAFMPSKISGKLDKQLLLDMTHGMEQSKLEEYSLVDVAVKESPRTEMERKMQTLWSDLLGISTEDIGRDDNFLQIGGDSMLAIQMATATREMGLSITVQDIFDDPRLLAVASKLEMNSEGGMGADTQPLQAFELLNEAERTALTGDAVREQCRLSSEQVIEDGFPCTKLQEGLMALTAKQSRAYVANYVYRIPPTVDLVRFKAAWEQTIELCANLRTRIISSNGQCYQLVLQNDSQWLSLDGKTLGTALEEIKGIEMGYGLPLNRYGLGKDREDGLCYFTWLTHHSVYDGWSMKLMLQCLHGSYHGLETMTLQPYSHFIRYVDGIDQDSTEEYWKTQLQGARRAIFPALLKNNQEKDTHISMRKFTLPKPADPNITQASICRAAWAVVLARYCDTPDICFGTTVSGRQAPVPGIDIMTGPIVATVPIRVQLQQEDPAGSLLQTVQKQALKMVSHEQFGLQRIAKLSTEIKDAISFSSLLVVQPAQSFGVESLEGDNEQILLPLKEGDENNDEGILGEYFSYPLVVQFYLHENREVDLQLIHDAKLLSVEQVDTISHHIVNTAKQLVQQEQQPLKQLSMIDNSDLEKVQSWNSEDFEVIDSSLPQLIKAQVKLRPDAPAVYAWDAQLTYSQLMESSLKLARYLITHAKVERGDLVLVGFEKSAWHIVAILAINLTGAAWVPLDLSSPLHRQQQIAKQTGATLALTSSTSKKIIEGLVQTTIEVSAELDQELSTTNAGELPVEIASSDKAYVLFTSGSTGTPKGLVMEHGAVCTSQIAISKRLGLGPEVRMLQFASFVFDLSIGELIAPLVSGACVCIPSDHARLNGLATFAREAGVNWAFLTPSFVRSLQPSDFPGLELLLLAGEAVGQDIVQQWFGKVRLVNGWGPAETCVFSTLHEWSSVDESALTIGRPVGSGCWIADQADSSRLAPVGTIGEIIIQGPTVLREYLSDPTQTKTAVMSHEDSPVQYPQTDAVRGRRCFRSGDLGYYNANGTIHFCSRRDTQIKIRGLRIELGEVEHNILKHLGSKWQVVVDVFKNDVGAQLVAYLCFRDDLQDSDPSSQTQLFKPMDDGLKDKFRALVGELGVELPSYMIPRLLVPCQYMPVITSTKIDRAKLRQRTMELTVEELAAYSLQDLDKRPPENAKEQRMQELWARVLNINSDLIGRDDSFLELGGDSIAAIHLVTAARESGLAITVKNIFDDPRLLILATKVVEESNDQKAVATPFSLLSSETRDYILSDKVRQNCHLDDEQVIEDAMPCTGLQEGLMALAVKQPGTYMARYVYSIPDHVDIDKFRAAWSVTVKLRATLRIRMVPVPGDGAVQVVVGDDVHWEDVDGLSLDQVKQQARAYRMSYGTRLCRYGISTEESTGEKHFVWTMHHTVFDGWSLNVILNTLQTAYQGTDPTPPKPWSTFVHYIQDVDVNAAEEYWKEQLQGSSQAAFPPSATTTALKSQAQEQDQDQDDRQKSTGIYKHSISLNTASSRQSITTATIVRAAWAIVLARYTESEDVCFGSTVSGRNASVPGLETIVGPTVATVPVRIVLDPKQPLVEFVDNVQSQAFEMTNFEQFGLKNISRVSKDAKEACEFSSLLVVQPVQQLTSAVSDDAILLPATSTDESMEGYFSYPLTVQALLNDDQIDLLLVYKPEAIPEFRLHALASHMESVIGQLMSAKTGQQLSDVAIAGPWDLEQAISWDTEKPTTQWLCVQELISAQAVRDATKEAIFSSNGSMSYAELDMSSTCLAAYLIKQGVNPGALVPICFDKCTLAIVVMIAVMKAGAAFIPLDPAHPISRRSEIIQQADAEYVITSNQGPEFPDQQVQVIHVDQSMLDELVSSSTAANLSKSLPKTDPARPAYVLFTSGSTGKPKGVVVEQAGLCASIQGHSSVYGIDTSTRTFQFSSYTFDASTAEIFSTLVNGGTVCVPSETERLENAVQFINSAKVNMAMLTPSFVRTFRPNQVPGLKTLILGGEAPSSETLQTWYDHVKLINGYGPSETIIYCCSHEYTSKEGSATTIGRGMNNSCWIVEPDNHNRLAPIGCTGELVVQGYKIARGYIKNEDKTKEVFINDVDWLPSTHRLDNSNGSSRFYKTGDLCRYNTDGSIEYVSRKDTQVKIRGLRVELGEVEHHVRMALESQYHVMVDVLKSEAGSTLACYICPNQAQKDANEADEMLAPMTEELKKTVNQVLGALRATLPEYMVPTTFIPCHHMPFGTSGKLDRAKLIQATNKLDRERLAEYALVDQVKTPPETPMELRLQKIWAATLRVSPDGIGRDDNFLRLGGDSITIIHMVTAAREDGIDIAVKDVFSDSRLSAVVSKARVWEEEVDGPGSSPEPFSLLDSSMSKEDLEQMMAHELSEAASQIVIEDAYPCSPLQDGLMALTAKQSGSYLSKYVFQIPQHVDLERFKEAWEQTVSACSNLRTRIVHTDSQNDGTSIQVVSHHGFSWEQTKGQDLSSFMTAAQSYEISYGTRLCRYALLQDAKARQTYFVLVAHHSIIDGWSLGIVQNVLHSAYHNLEMPKLAPYSTFIAHLISLNEEQARSYWQQQLTGASRPSFPPRQSSPGKTRTSQIAEQWIELPLAKDSSITKATILRTAWAMVLARHSDTDDVCFGAIESGRNASLRGIETISGPLIATVPVRVILDKDLTVDQTLERLQEQTIQMSEHEHYGLQKISKISPEAKDACDFSSLFAVQPKQTTGTDNSPGTEHAILTAPDADSYDQSQVMGNSYFNYPLVMDVALADDGAQARLIYDTASIDEGLAQALLHQLSHVTLQLSQYDDKTIIGSLSLTGPWDLEHARQSSTLEPSTETCTHWVIQDQIKQRPDSIAVSAWDAELSYRKLGQLALRLAWKLKEEFAVGPETFVPFCIPKSSTAIVAMLAIQLAGGAFAPLDPAAPVDRLRGIITDTKAELVLIDASLDDKFKQIEDVQSFVISNDLLDSMDDAPESQLPLSSVKPNQPSLVIFTSGSTGRPKGIVMEHRSTSSLAAEYGAKVNLGPESRVFQFSAYTFDAGIYDVLVTLMRGGCICVPSDHDRMNNIAGAINASRANWVLLTPTVAQLLEPSEVPTLKTVCLGGEAVTNKVTSKWKDHVDLYGLYGPAESSICAWRHVKSDFDSARSGSLGEPISSSFWVVEPDNPERLTPVGCIGELVIQGPMLARGYLDTHGEASKNWIQDADRYFPINEAGITRAYRSGDLVRRNYDATYDYIGRKDTQVKLHGQRIEMGEIESRLLEHLPSGMSGLVEVITSEAEGNGSKQETLMALLWHTEGPNAEGTLLHLTDDVTSEMQSLISSLNASLGAILPSYMLPGNFLVFIGEPEQTTSGKVNRRHFKSLASQVSTQDRLRFDPENMAGEPPSTEMEITLRDMWLNVLDVTKDDITKDSNFLRLGGDSISAMRLVTAAAQHEITLNVSTIFGNPRLAAMAVEADKAGFNAESELHDEPAFSLLPSDEVDEILSTARQACGLDREQTIQDAYPCTSMQRRYIESSTTTHPGSFIAKTLYRLPEGIDPSRFRKAWSSVVQMCSILRTRVVMHREQPIQVVIDDEVNWDSTDVDLRTYMASLKDIRMGYGDKLSRFTMVEEGGENYFIWVIHHFLYDGYSMGMIMNLLSEVYENTASETVPISFSGFVKHTKNLDTESSTAYWAQQLDGARQLECPANIPKDLLGVRRKNITRSLSRTIELPSSVHTSITMATLVRAAWGLVLAHNNDDTNAVSFIASSSGRQAPVRGLDRLMGPTNTVFPVRMRLDSSKTVSDLLSTVQSEALEMAKHEHLGTHTISELSHDAAAACDASTLLVIQPATLLSGVNNHQVLMPDDSGILTKEDVLDGFDTFPLVVQAATDNDNVAMSFNYDCDVLNGEQVLDLLDQFEIVAHRLQTQTSTELRDITYSLNQ